MPEPEVVLAEESVVLKPEDAPGALLEYTEIGDTTITQNYVEAQNIGVGSVLASGITPQAPQGFLRKVTVRQPVLHIPALHEPLTGNFVP